MQLAKTRTGLGNYSILGYGSCIKFELTLEQCGRTQYAFNSSFSNAHSVQIVEVVWTVLKTLILQILFAIFECV